MLFFLRNKRFIFRTLFFVSILSVENVGARLSLLGASESRQIFNSASSASAIELLVAEFGKDPSETHPGQYVGAFSRIEDCQSSKNSLSTQFSRQFEVPVLDSYCTKGQSLYGPQDAGYVLRIVGGARGNQVQASFQLLGIRQYSEVGPIPMKVVEDLAERIRKDEGVIAHVDKGFVWYYSVQPAAVKVWMVPGLEFDSACRIQKDHIIKALTKLGSDAAPTFYCLDRAKAGSVYQRGIALWNGRRSVELSALPLKNFKNLKECIEEIPRLEQSLFHSSDFQDIFKEPLGIVCVAETGGVDLQPRYEAKVIETWRSGSLF